MAVHYGVLRNVVGEPGRAAGQGGAACQEERGADEKQIKLLTSLGQIFTQVGDTQRWLIKLHPVRIIAGDDQGQPAPDGRHRDGVTFVGSLLIDRLNITGGQSSTYDHREELMMTTTLGEVGDLLPD